MKILFYGASGWIGSLLSNILKQQNIQFIIGKARLDNCEDLSTEIKNILPTHILCTAGKTGTPNVDWCEYHKAETLRTNIVGIGNLGYLCNTYNIHLTYFGTGCIYEYDYEHTIENQRGFTEEDEPNFEKSFYSKTKAIAEKDLIGYNNILILRIRMPLDDILSNKNFITKITKYEKVVNIPNSMTVLYELLPISIKMMINKNTGIYNFTNPGVISHNEILDLYTKYIDPLFTYRNFSLEEQAKVIKVDRSNNCLDVTKLKNLYKVQPIKKASTQLFIRMRDNMVDDLLEEYPKVDNKQIIEESCLRGDLIVLHKYLTENVNGISAGFLDDCFISAVRNGHLNIIKYLKKEYNIKLSQLQLENIFIVCCKVGICGILKCINHQYGFSYLFIKKPEIFCTGFVKACESGHLELIIWLHHKFINEIDFSYNDLMYSYSFVSAAYKNEVEILYY